MARSLLKTKISEILGIERGKISFDVDDETFKITIGGGENLLKFEVEESNYCCGVLDCGETDWSPSLFSSLDEDTRNSLTVDCFNQLYKMIKENVSTKGLLTWTHTNDNQLAIALRSEYNTESMPWKFIQEFYNPNSSNTVNYFIANLN